MANLTPLSSFGSPVPAVTAPAETRLGALPAGSIAVERCPGPSGAHHRWFSGSRVHSGAAGPGSLPRVRTSWITVRCTPLRMPGRQRRVDRLGADWPGGAVDDERYCRVNDQSERRAACDIERQVGADVDAAERDGRNGAQGGRSIYQRHGGVRYATRAAGDGRGHARRATRGRDGVPTMPVLVLLRSDRALMPYRRRRITVTKRVGSPLIWGGV